MNKIAILIDNQRLRNAMVSPELGSSADMEGLATLFKEPVCAFMDVVLLKDRAHHEILYAINKVLNEAERDSFILILYRGHCILDRDLQLQLLASNTEIPLLKATAIPVANLKEYVSLSRCQRFVFVFDFIECSYESIVGRDGVNSSGQVDVRLMELAEEFDDGRGRFVLSARPQDGAVLQRTPNNTLCSQLRASIREWRADVNGDGAIDIGEVADYIISNSSGVKVSKWQSGATGTLILARKTAIGIQDAEMKAALRKLPVSERAIKVRGEAERILSVPRGIRIKAYEPLYLLLEELARGDLSAEKFLEYWVAFGQIIPGSGDEAVPIEKRWHTVSRARIAVMEVIGPAYMLDEAYHFLDWNAAFDEIIAKPLGLSRGRPVSEFVKVLENTSEVVEHSLEVFDQAELPLVDIEVLHFRSKQYGLIRFRKLAAQISDEQGGVLAWSVQLNITDAEETGKLWSDVQSRLEQEVNWSKYAGNYDKLLRNFDTYGNLIEQIVTSIPSGGICADLAAGTGNGALRLLECGIADEVWAFEANEEMLRHLRGKSDRFPANTFHVVKGDIATSLHEVTEGFFDSAIMVNALYAIDDKQRCLREVCRVLKTGGILVLSTSHKMTDVDRLFAEIESNLRGKGLLEELGMDVERARERHNLLDGAIHSHTVEDIVQIVEGAGFILQEQPKLAYCDAVVVIKAMKGA